MKTLIKGCPFCGYPQNASFGNMIACCGEVIEPIWMDEDGNDYTEEHAKKLFTSGEAEEG